LQHELRDTVQHEKVRDAALMVLIVQAASLSH
jgi:hypothetical protein